MATLPRPASTGNRSPLAAHAAAPHAAGASAPAAALPVPGAAVRGASSADVPLSSMPLSALTPPPGSMPVNPFLQRPTRSVAVAGPVAALPGLDGLRPGGAYGGADAASLSAMRGGMAGMRSGAPGGMLSPQGMPYGYPGANARGYSAPTGVAPDLAAMFKGLSVVGAGSAVGVPASGPGLVQGGKDAAASPRDQQVQPLQRQHQQQQQRVGAAVKPRLLPPPPYMLTNFVITLAVRLAELRASVEQALYSNNVDFEYNEAKWKAKCFIYRSCGYANFCVRMFTRAATPTGGAGGGSGDRETYVVELQRRKGCPVVFRETYDRLLAALMRAGAVHPECDAARRARAIGLVDRDAGSTTSAPAADGDAGSDANAATAATRSTSAPAAAGAARPCPCPPKSLSSDRDADPEDDETLPVGYRSDSSTTSGGGASGSSMSAAEASSIADAFATLSVMLQAPYDDVSAPAAQSIASLSVSRRVRAALGIKAAAGMAYVPSQQGVPAAAPAGAAAAGSGDSSLMVVHLFEALLQRLEVAWTNPATNARIPLASIEARTACAIAIANLCQNAQCAAMFAALRAHVRLMDAVAFERHGAATAAFRRECLRAVYGILLAVPAAPRTALELDAKTRMASIGAAYRGLDSCFDRYVDGIGVELQRASPAGAASHAGAHAGSGVPQPRAP